MTFDRTKPHIMAIVFEVEGETGHRAVRDIICVEGTDRNAKRRLRRRVLSFHAGWIDQIVYETRLGDGSEAITTDMTRHYKDPTNV
jgi:hypothetical protein